MNRSPWEGFDEMSIEKEKEEFAARGYFIVDDLLDPDLLKRRPPPGRLEQGAVRRGGFRRDGSRRRGDFRPDRPQVWRARIRRAFPDPEAAAIRRGLPGKGVTAGLRPPAQRPGVLRHRLEPGRRGDEQGNLPYVGTKGRSFLSRSRCRAP